MKADVSGRVAVESLLAQAQARARSTLHVSRGLPWSVLMAGSGPRTLVFLPGALGSPEIFARQLLSFSVSCRVLVLGYPGESDRQRMTGSFIDLLDVLGIRDACFIGSSLGAYWLQVFTASRPDIAQALVLGNTFVDAAPLQSHPLFDQSFLDSASAEAVHARSMEYLAQQPDSLLRALLLELAGRRQSAEELRGRLRTVAHAHRVPLSAVPPGRMTLVACEDDPITGGAARDALRAAYPGAREVCLPHGGHYPHFNEPDVYDQIITRACGLQAAPGA